MIAGPKQPGRITGDIGWHTRQSGVVSLSERKLRIEKPRLRKKGKATGKEVAIPAYFVRWLPFGQKDFYYPTFPEISIVLGVYSAAIIALLITFRFVQSIIVRENS